MQDLTDAYDNRAYIPGGDDYPPRWMAQAAAFRDAHDVRELPGFHAGTRRAVDVVSPEDSAQGTVIFVHGGYWRAFDKSVWTHLAAGAVQRGWRVALPGYALCPDVRIRDITRQTAEAITAVAQATDGPITLTGHSAGGHLVARMLAPGMLAPEVLARITRVAPISMLSDLRPLLQTAMNADLRLDAEEAAEESPLLQSKPATEVALWVGAEERPTFLDQTRWLSEAWRAPQHILPGRHHFDVIEPLEDAQSGLVRFLTGHAA
ncbi:alpha/beta hydrolase [Primorskyibacter aestuariivivens]|uniref:alpha/beta hydrolase n=1 Tax=Primorskyibacter aestuariivivens TaxID=1888912 RepID=UPI00230127CA|nr:alpha/beta hydrolase [Primorskyibacter aestuariivivens]MDA7429917.1 alpha/beta hydrolase [Primorskyibacter aestuariivivens]